jgi:L-threonylcarbamoyladenylate synthase
LDYAPAKQALAYIIFMLHNFSVQNNTPVPVFTSLIDPDLIDTIRNDGVGVLLTDTVYGIVGRAESATAANRVIEAKGRKYKPGTLIAASVQQLIDLGLPAAHLKIVQHFWPGSVSVVIPAGPELEHIHLGKGSIVVRIPDKPELLDLLKAVGPLLTTSANLPDEPMVNDIAEAQELFGRRLNFYVDGGRLSDPVASTIIRLDIEVLRQGAVSIDHVIDKTTKSNR